MSTADWGNVAVVVGGIATVATLAGLAWRRLHGLAARIGEFLDDWGGIPARPGVAPRPGVMERLASQDEQIARVVDQVQQVVDELPKNGTPLAHKIDALWTKYVAETEGVANR